MDRRLGQIAPVAILALAVLFHLLTRVMAPLTGYFVALLLYWLLLGVALWRCRGWSLRLVRPHGAVIAAFAAIILAALWLGRDCLAPLSPGVMAAVIAAAVLNGTLEEAFWRGALVRDLRPGDWLGALPPLALFILWHVAPAAGAARLVSPCTDMNMLLAAAILGVPAMAARLTSGTAGAGALGHVLVNLATFWILAAHPPAWGRFP